jgi:hypothetical protein
MSSPDPSAETRTIVCPHLDIEQPPRTNLVWSAGLALGWRKLIERAGGPIELAGVDPEEPAAKLVRALNRSAADAGTLSLDLGGVCEGSVETASGRISVAGSLSLHPQFAVPFHRSTWPKTWHRRRFHNFGLWYDAQETIERWEQRGAQVIVHFPRWRADELDDLSEEENDAAYNQLVVELRPEGCTTSIIISAVAQGATLRDTLAHALSYLQDDDGAHPMARFTRQEGLIVPVIDLRCAMVAPDLRDCVIENAPLRGERLGDLRQTIRFTLDEGGPGLLSSPTNPYGPALTAPRRWYDWLLFFHLAVIDRRTRMPIFTALIENTDVFVEAPAPPLPTF